MPSTLRVMRARDPEQQHRASTPLELFFDLTFVVAVSLAAEGLAHQLAEDHGWTALLTYVAEFFAIWWGWLNFTWFASAYDTDDWLYRVMTLVQMSGALVVAAGIPDVVDHRDFTTVTFGYVVMRLAMVGQWLRAAHADPQRRPAALRYAVGVTVVQILWVARLALPHTVGLAVFPVLGLAELAVPPFAERAAQTTYHPRHIAERYGLFTLIVLGEGILASANAVIAAIHEGDHVGELLVLAACGLVVLAGMWWFYFAYESDDLGETLASTVVWGYGHYLVFASAAAVSSGIELQVDQISGHAHAPRLVVGLTLAVALAVFLVMTWHLVMAHRAPTWFNRLVPVAAVLVVLAGLLPGHGLASAVVDALLLVALVAALATTTATPHRR